MYRVSLLICMRNEARYIEGCLRSILAQDYPAEFLQVLIIDGQSTDNSRAIVERLIANQPHCQLIHNPKMFQAAGWNIGIECARGDIIGIVSAHSELAPDYVSQAVSTLQRTNADLVGGPMRAFGQGAWAQVTALATSSPFGVGGARFHYAEREEQVDTVYMGVCRREVYARIGGFDEEMVRNQDDELSYRLLEHGGKIICNPAIKSKYFNRADLPGLGKQYVQYGFWKVRVMQKHPRQMRLRQFVPPTFVAALLGAAILAPVFDWARVLFALTLSVYLATNLAVSFRIARATTWKHLHRLPIIFATLHFSYGSGFLAGLARFGFAKTRSEGAKRAKNPSGLG